jgi:hypothetical protein
MSDWELEHSAESKAPPASVWERYTDVEDWREWSKGVEESTLEGEFEAGSKGTMKPPQLPRTGFELVEVEPERRFVSRAKLPGGTLTFDHRIEPANGGTRITHKASLDGGPLRFVWVRMVNWIVKRELPESVDRLAELAYEKQQEARQEAKEQEERKERLHKADQEFKQEIEKTSGERDAGGASLPGTG